MRVVQARTFGGPEVLELTEAPEPAAGPGQVVVGVSVADVLFLDTQIRRGLHRDSFPVDPPYVPGAGVAGEVIAIGKGADSGWLGQRVIASPGHRGGYAERAVAPAAALIPVPDRLDLRQAAALLHDGRTAQGLVEGAGIRRGEWVLVLAAAGGLGILLVQLARAAGARVIAAARGGRKLDLARELGAEAVVDYTEPGWTELVREATGGGPDVVFDGAGGEIGRAAFAITAHGGRFSAHGAPGGAFARIDPQEAQRHAVALRGIEHVQFAPAEGKRLTARALSEAVAGRIRPVIGQAFPLDRAAAAHATIEARRVLGKTLLLV